MISSILPLLNIFRDLLLKNAFRYESLELLESLIVYLPHDCYKNYLNIIYQLLFGQLQVCVLFSLHLLASQSCQVHQSCSLYFGCFIRFVWLWIHVDLLVKHAQTWRIYEHDVLTCQTHGLCEWRVDDEGIYLIAIWPVQAIIVGICRMIYEDPFFKTSEATQLNITILCSLINMVENKSSESLTFSPIDPTNEDGEDEFEVWIVPPCDVCSLWSLSMLIMLFPLLPLLRRIPSPLIIVSMTHSLGPSRWSVLLCSVCEYLCCFFFMGIANLMPMLEQVCPAITEMNKDKVAAYIQASLHS